MSWSNEIYWKNIKAKYLAVISIDMHAELLRPWAMIHNLQNIDNERTYQPMKLKLGNYSDKIKTMWPASLSKIVEPRKKTLIK